MKVYLDNNIFISIEDNELDFNLLRDFFPLNTNFFYSYVHIQELLQATSNLDKLIKIRLETIEKITNNNYLFPVKEKIKSKIEKPIKVISIIQQHPYFFESFRTAAKALNINRTKFIQELKIDTKELNNFNPKVVVNHINHLLKNAYLPEFNNIINLTGNNLHQRIATIFNFLDIIGYWKDRKNLKSDLARMYDASHAFFSSGCDYFISNDKRARNKIKVAFEMYNIRTKVLSYEELTKKYK